MIIIWHLKENKSSNRYLPSSALCGRILTKNFTHIILVTPFAGAVETRGHLFVGVLKKYIATS